MTPLDEKPPLASSHKEAEVWSRVDGTWRPVHGSFCDKGMSIEWHEFSVSEGMDWSESFHPQSLEVCLNYSGQGSLKLGRKTHEVVPEQIALYTTAEERAMAVRRSGHLHRFFTIELSPDFLRTQFAFVIDGLLPEIRAFMENPAGAAGLIQTAAMPPSLLSYRMHLLEPPVNPGARGIWYHSKVVEILTHLLFKPEAPTELFCSRQNRLNKERCERVLFLLERDLENPPSLEMLATEVDCSPFYLSRVFSQETGMGIPKYLRLKRIEKAGELLRSGKMNVTEAAMAVGYSSLSAFNKAFVEQMGCCPGLYPHLKAPPMPRKIS
jgi:AraC family transcriptional regulator